MSFSVLHSIEGITPMRLAPVNSIRPKRINYSHLLETVLRWTTYNGFHEGTMEFLVNRQIHGNGQRDKPIF